MAVGRAQYRKSHKSKTNVLPLCHAISWTQKMDSWH